MSDKPRPSIELADEAGASPRAADRRPPIPELPSVRLLAVEDVTILAPSGAERELDALYVEVLRFLRIDEVSEKRTLVQPILDDDVPKVPPAREALRRPSATNEHVIHGPVYLAENLRLHVEIHEPPIEHPDLRPVKVQVPLLSVITESLDQRQMAYTRQVGIFPGDRSILLQDAAGNWVEVTESRPI
jgi:hypothetical protein